MGDWLPGWPSRRNRRNGELFVDLSDSEIEMRVPDESCQISVASAPARITTNDWVYNRSERSSRSVPPRGRDDGENDEFEIEYVNDEYDEGANSDAESDYEYSTADEDELYKVTNDPHSQSNPYNYSENRRSDQGFGPNTRSCRTDQELDRQIVNAGLGPEVRHRELGILLELTQLGIAIRPVRNGRGVTRVLMDEAGN